MNCLSWNCRGLGNPCTVQELTRLVRVKAPSAIFLMETWSNEDYLEVLRCNLQVSNKLVVQNNKKGGGLALLWNDDLDVSIKSYSNNHIDAVINEGKPDAWRLTGVYGAPETQNRYKTWDLLRRLDGLYQLPWCCVGDFNEVVKLEEMHGRFKRPDRQMQAFRSVLDECGLMDLGFNGFPYTWCNNRDPPHTTWVRLDRAVATADWLAKYPRARVDHLDVIKSDHKCLWVVCEPPRSRGQRRRPFRFEEMWISDSGCERTIMEAWRCDKPGTEMFQVSHKLRECKLKLGTWSRECFGNLGKKIAEAKQELQQAEARVIQGVNAENLQFLRRTLNALFEKEEKMWRQRSRSLWLSNGDRNTKYFHSRATQRRRRNHIQSLRDNMGVIHDTNEGMASLLINYYENLFSTSQPMNIDDVVANVSHVVSEDMNKALVREFTASEVEIAIKQMAPTKAPGPDGMPPVFYQKFWHVVGSDVTKAVLSCLNSGRILKSINHTFITLVPKVKSPERVTEFRPISLCNVIYKLISKVLANRLKLILPRIVSDSQSTFVPGRLITDNVLVAFETLHYMHHNKIGRDGAMALKLDMSKAYDRVEWRFLEQIMSQMGFHQKWISLMTECISTISYSILVNGEPHGYIQPSRGLRQGDPLSPYLFLLCAEGLHSLIHKARLVGDIQGISLCRGGPRITHLFFADDSLLFSKATPRACETIQSILSQYENASGQQVNREKTAIYFSKHTPEASQNDIKEALEVPIIRQYEKYLGLPSFVGRNRSESLTQIKERVWQKLKGWKEKLLSQAGREILIKAVAQAIPTYSMSCFRLPSKLCTDLESMVRRFWWSNKTDQRKIHWIAWRKLCQPKNKGGLGFRDLKKFNEALLAKQVWRLIHDTSSLFYRVFKAKFFPHGSILDCPTTTRGSYAWQSILKAREVISRGAVWRVGNGENINIWRDRWLLEDHHRRIITPGPNLLVLSTVNELIIEPQMVWDHSLIDNLFLPYDAKAIKHIPLSKHKHADKITWPGNMNGEYSVRSGYSFLVDEEDKSLPSSSRPDPRQSLWRSIWDLKIPKKCQMFAWKACREALPTKLNLLKRHIPVDSTCENCGETEEDAIHALWNCKQLQSVWDNESWTQPFRNTLAVDFADLLSKVLHVGSSSEPEIFIVMCWALWQRRNKLRLHQEVEPINQVGSKAKCYLEEFNRENDHSNAHPQAAPETRWLPPKILRYKINYDGAVFKETNEAGIGVIVRDFQGLVMASLTQKVLFPLSVPSIEAWAVKRAVQFALELGITEAEFEGDSQTIVNALNTQHPSLAPFGLLIADAKELASKLQHSSFSHVKRAGNCLAHALARKAYSCNSLEVWMESVPPDLEQLYLSCLNLL